MSFPEISFSKKEKTTIVLAVTLGNLLEWYEIYLYVHWAPIIARLFFNSGSEALDLTYTFLMFAIGFLARPFGGVFFGRLGDAIGRRKALIASLVVMTIPTFVTGLLPTHAQIGLAAPIILGIMRLLQAFPAGGELPGAFCYLYESSRFHQRRFMSSWGAMGYQLGILISTFECYFLEKYLSPEDLLQWGWRFSFLIGGLIGLCGLFMRYRLHETPLYREMMTHEKIAKEPVLKVLNKHKKGIGIGFLFCALNSSMFYFLSVNFPAYFSTALGDSYSPLVITMMILLFITIPLPFFGMLADKMNNKTMLLTSTVGIIVLLYPLYLAVIYSSVVFMILITILMGLFFTCLSALIPYIMPALFPINVRFTCVGLSFNLVDATIGGFTPVMAMCLVNATGDQASFCWLLLAGGVLSLIGFLLMKNDKPHVSHKHL